MDMVSFSAEKEPKNRLISFHNLDLVPQSSHFCFLSAGISGSDNHSNGDLLDHVYHIHTVGYPLNSMEREYYEQDKSLGMQDNFHDCKPMAVVQNENMEVCNHDNQDIGCSDSRHDIPLDVDNHGFHHKAKTHNV